MNSELEILQTELKTGSTLCGGKYIIEKKIGAGGFGITYAAKHATLEKKYAIKEFFLSGYNVRYNTTNQISIQGIGKKDFNKIRLRFVEEARMLASLNNDAVVKVIDIFDENGTSYMVMPFIEGHTLQSIVEKNGPMEYEMAVNYIVRICDALAYIHSKNILHRDVTPDNIIVTPEQKTVLIDFGSARKFVNDKTQRHTTILKQGYAPLEQYSATSRKGAYTDLYSLGGVFYYILTGKRPMDATERTMEQLIEPIVLSPQIPEQINSVIMKAMAMDCSERYQSAQEFEEDILSGNYPQMNTKSKHQIQKAPQNRDRRLRLLLVFISTAMCLFLIMGLIKKWSTVPPSDNSVAFTEIIPNPMDSLKKENIDVLIKKLNEDPDNQMVLYVISQKVADEYAMEDDDEENSLMTNPSLISFWNTNLVPNGDVIRSCKTDTSYYPFSFSFVCANRAYKLLKNKNEINVEDKSLLDSIHHLLNRLQDNIDDGKNYVIYE